ncbi:MAG: TonB-dependent receptor [Candidatus Tectomicrobia bacterium]|nr:TonB-dependent receptor [Candidatus Tectomicrobia bacterium]
MDKSIFHSCRRWNAQSRRNLSSAGYTRYAFVERACMAICLAALLWPTQSAAQVLEEIIVTAQKREQAINDVGIAVIAFSGEQVDELGFESSLDVVRMSPGVHYTAGAAGRNLKFTIRGVTQFDFFEGVEGPIAVYIDDTYITSAQAQVFGLFDVERVEVLKGPQGTLFGRNATGGLLHYMSRKPTLDRSDGYIDLTYGRFDQVRAEAAANVVLSDTTALRGSVLYNRYDHTIDNAYPEGAISLNPNPVAQPDLGSDDTWAGRLHLLHAPSDDVELLLTGFHYRSEPGAAPYESDAIIAERDAQGRHINTYFASPNETREQIGPGGVSVPISFLDGEVPGFTEDGLRPVPGGDLFGYLDDDLGDFAGTHDYAPEDTIRLQTSGVTGKLTWALSDRIELTSITDYKRYANRNSLNVGGIPASHFLFLTDSKSESFAQELRLNGDTEKASWTAGLYYLYIDNDTDTGLAFPGDSILTFSPPPFGLDPNPFDAFPGPGTDFVNETSLTTNSTSVFGQADYDLTGTITLIAGIRVVFEDKDYSLAQNAYEDTDPTRLNTENFGFAIPQPPRNLSTTLRH